MASHLAWSDTPDIDIGAVKPTSRGISFIQHTRQVRYLIETKGTEINSRRPLTNCTIVQ